MSLIPRKRMSSDLLDPKPKKGSYNGVTSDGVFNATGEAIDNILDDGSASESIVVAVPSSQSGNYVVGNYYEVQGKVAKLRTKTEGDDVTQLTFDTTSGLLDAMNDVVGDIASLGNSLQWKGPATVAELNAGITGIQPGWTYTLTDAGTLTDGSITVDVGDEVAWTENDEWFKVGGENSTVALFRFTGTDYPLNADMNDEFLKGKTVVLMHNPGGTQYDFYYLVQRASGSGHVTMYFKGRYNSIKVADDTWTFYNDSINAVAVAPLYDSTSTYPTVGTAVMYSGKRYVSNTAINTAEDWTPAHWTQRDVETDIVALKSAIGSVKNGGALTDGASVNVPNNALSTLSTAQATLTLNVNVSSDEVPNFAVEVSPSADCTLTVTKTVGNTTTTLNPSVAGGDSLTTGKMYQVTCVGSCWTLAEFTVPTP